ncbi:MAG: DUF4180 domain-containing protein [Clostridiaceae bacterium]
MNYEIKLVNGKTIAVIKDESALIKDVQSALDLIATISYESGAEAIVLLKENITEDFFDLKTKIAGDILQKFTNYKMKLAVIGDFSNYTSKSLKDFIFESNKQGNILFLPTVQNALDVFGK